MLFAFSITVVNATPLITTDTVCVGNQTHFTLSNISGITAVHWDFGDFATGDTSNFFNPVYNYIGSGVFTVKLIYQSGATVDSVFKDILVLGIPNPGLPGDLTLCSGTYGLNANYPYGDSYLWSTGATTQFIQYSTQGTYWIQVTNMCGIGSDTFQVTFIPPPIAQLPLQDFICPGGDQDTLVAGPNSSSFTYQWTTGETTNAIIVTQPGSYFVQIYNQCGTLNTYSNVYIMQPPHVELGTSDTVLCGDAQLEFDVFIPTCQLCTYEWSSGEVTPFSMINTEGTSWITISNECGIASDSITINYLPYPFYVFNNDTTICNEQTLQFNLSLEDGDFLWQDGSTDSSYMIDTTGTFYVTQHNYCASLTDTIHVKKLTIGLDFGFDDSLLCRGEKLTLNAYQPEGNYLWNTGSSDTTLEITTEGIYSVVASNYCGTATDELQIYFQNCDACLHIPTAFSPNQDGHNDRYKVLHDCPILKFELHIFNRWGQLVYSTVDPDLSWDGKYLNEDLPIDVYPFEISYTRTDFKTETTDYIKGNITLMR